MKKLVMALSVALVAQASFAAIQYEFRQTARSDSESVPQTDLSGHAVIDGQKSRVDFTAGNAYPPGTYVVSTNGSRTMRYVDPTMHQYVEVNAAGVASSIGSIRITVGNQRDHLDKLDDHPIIAGHPTNHYRLTLDYDIAVAFGAIPLKQTVHTQIDKWTTIDFGDVADTFLGNNTGPTGNPQLDELIGLENTKIKGFALRETRQTTTRNSQATAPDSKLNINPTRTSTREMVITSISEAAPAPGMFTVPPTYKRYEAGQTDPKAPPSTQLSLEPPSGQ
jgi:hypothetical protein